MILISWTRIFFLSDRARNLLIILGFALIQPLVIGSERTHAGADGSRVLHVVEMMESSFHSVVDYSCEVDQVYYQDGKEDQHYQFKFYYKKDRKIRVDFISPYSGMRIYYQGDDKEVTVKPFQFFPSLKFRFLVTNPLIRTAAGQTLDQTDMGYFINFLMKNLKRVKQGDDEFFEDREQIRFLLLGMDYIEDKNPEKYRISVSKKNYLPTRIERYDLEGKVIEVSVIRDYAINRHLDEKFFIP